MKLTKLRRRQGGVIDRRGESSGLRTGIQVGNPDACDTFSPAYGDL